MCWLAHHDTKVVKLEKSLLMHVKKRHHLLGLRQLVYEWDFGETLLMLIKEFRPSRNTRQVEICKNQLPTEFTK